MGSEKGTSKAGSDGSWLQGISEPNRPNSSLPPKRDEKVTETFLSQKITTLSQKTVILLNTSTTAGSTLLCSTGLTPPSDTNLTCILSCSTSHSYQKTKPQNPHSECTAPAVRVSSVCVCGGKGLDTDGRTASRGPRPSRLPETSCEVPPTRSVPAAPRPRSSPAPVGIARLFAEGTATPPSKRGRLPSSRHPSGVWAKRAGQRPPRGRYLPQADVAGDGQREGQRDARAVLRHRRAACTEVTEERAGGSAPAAPLRQASEAKCRPALGRRSGTQRARF